MENTKRDKNGHFVKQDDNSKDKEVKETKGVNCYKTAKPVRSQVKSENKKKVTSSDFTVDPIEFKLGDLIGSFADILKRTVTEFETDKVFTRKQMAKALEAKEHETLQKATALCYEVHCKVLRSSRPRWLIAGALIGGVVSSLVWFLFT